MTLDPNAPALVEYPIYSVGTDELYEPRTMRPNAEWLVYCYISGSYDGSGYAVYKIGDSFHVFNLGHCSCYGPLDSGDDPQAILDLAGLDKWFSHDGLKERVEGDYDWQYIKPIADKVRALIAALNESGVRRG